MNNSINYSGFVEMFLDSDDDFEPYGCVNTIATDTSLSGKSGCTSVPRTPHREEDAGDD